MNSRRKQSKCTKLKACIRARSGVRMSSEFMGALGSWDSVGSSGRPICPPRTEKRAGEGMGGSKGGNQAEAAVGAMEEGRVECRG
jgi:hypothetical protein